MATETEKHAFTFPPFPSPPEGVVITPFSQFDESKWAIRAYSADDTIEVDAQGVETVSLKKRHDIDRCKSNRKGARFINAPSKDTPASAAGETGERKAWYEAWKDDAPTKFATGIDLRRSFEDRLVAASEQFTTCRKMGPVDAHSPAGIWDQFRFYTGFVTGASKKKKGQAAQLDDDDDEELPHADMPISEQDGPSNEKLERFSRDMAESLRVFFTQWMQDRGQHVMASNLITYPYVVLFFLDFVQRSRILHDKEKVQLEAAIKVTEQALRELPVTHSLAQCLPDEWSSALRELWGTRIPPFKWSVPDEDDNVMAEIWKSGKRHGNPNTEPVEEVQAPVDDGWGNPTEVEQGTVEEENAWGASATGDGDGWGAEDPDPVEDLNWAQDLPPLPSVLQWLGPTALPETHGPGIVECSVRRIKEIIPAGERLASDEGFGAARIERHLQAVFDRVVLEPWLVGKKPAKGEMDDPLPPPTIRSTSRGLAVIPDSNAMETGDGMAHDSLVDDIHLLVETKHRETFERGLGLGVKATWIQIARAEDVEGGVMRKGGGWYTEEVTNLYPSFYTTQEQIDSRNGAS